MISRLTSVLLRANWGGPILGRRQVQYWNWYWSGFKCRHRQSLVLLRPQQQPLADKNNWFKSSKIGRFWFFCVPRWNKVKQHFAKRSTTATTTTTTAAMTPLLPLWLLVCMTDIFSTVLRLKTYPWCTQRRRDTRVRNKWFIHTTLLEMG